MLAHNLKTLTGPITYFAVDMVADININEVTKKHAVPLYIKGLKRGLVPAAGAVRLQIWERLVAANRHKGLHYTDFSGQMAYAQTITYMVIFSLSNNNINQLKQTIYHMTVKDLARLPLRCHCT